MTNKIISVSTLLCMITVLLMARISPSDPLFSFISLEPVASTVRFLLVLAMIAVTFKTLTNQFLRRTLATAGLGLIVLGIANFLFAPVYGLVYDYLMPLDVLLLIESGIVFSAVAFERQIEPKHSETEGVRIPVRVTA